MVLGQVTNTVKKKQVIIKLLGVLPSGLEEIMKRREKKKSLILLLSLN